MKRPRQFPDFIKSGPPKKERPEPVPEPFAALDEQPKFRGGHDWSIVDRTPNTRRLAGR